MARKNVSEVEVIHSSDTLTVIREGHPVNDLRRKFRKNIHKANRIAKKILAQDLKFKLSKGVKGESYHPVYAKRKNKFAKGGPYSTSGPVNFRYSGRLWNELVGRGRAKPSELSLQVWVGLKNRNKTRPASAPGGGGITYGWLVDHLKKTKPGTEGNPFTPRKKEIDSIARRTVERLMRGEGAK